MTDRAASALILQILRETAWILIDFVIRKIKRAVPEYGGKILLKKINKEKDMTILISSHILSELSELATTYGIISNGKLIEEITAKQLSEKCRQYIDLKVDDTAWAVILLERELGISVYEVLEDSNIKVFSNLDNVSEVNSLLSRSGIIVESISVKGENLEEYFMNKVGGVLNA